MRVSHRRRAAAIGITLAVLAPLAAMAQKAEAPSGSVPIIRDIPLEDWRARVLGRTVHYYIDGEPFGREYYFPDGRGVIFQHVGGTCLEGEWVYREAIAAYCYLWPEAVSCFRHVMRGDETLILPVEPDGSPSLSGPQTVERITPQPLSCGPAVTS